MSQGPPGYHPVVTGVVAICPRCRLPSFLTNELQVPTPPFGNAVEHLPGGISDLYSEARQTMQADAPTAAAMAGRKVLMAVAVERGAPENQSFKQYVEWLVAEGYVTPPMRGWVDEIRELGNDAVHEIQLITTDAAADLLMFVTMLLQVVYEYPERASRSAARRGQPDGTA